MFRSINFYSETNIAFFTSGLLPPKIKPGLQKYFRKPGFIIDSCIALSLLPVAHSLAARRAFWSIGRSCVLVATSESPDVVGKYEHKILLQHIRFHVFYVSSGNVALNAIILVQQIEAGKFNFALVIFEELFTYRRIPKHVILIDAAG